MTAQLSNNNPLNWCRIAWQKVWEASLWGRAAYWKNKHSLLEELADGLSARHADEVRSLTFQLNQYRGWQYDMHREKDEMLKEMSRLHIVKEGQESTIANFEKTIHDLKQQLASALEDLYDTSQKYPAARAEVDSWRHRYDELSKHCKTLEDNLAATQAELEKSKEWQEVYHSRCRKLEHEAGEMMAEQISYNQIIEQLEKEREDIREGLVNASRQIKAFIDEAHGRGAYVGSRYIHGDHLPRKARRCHLCFCMNAAYDCGVKNHPQKVMRELGITYQHATPQSIADQWWFWNCENTPKELPEYLEVADWNPMEMIGRGLSKEDAKAIRDYARMINEVHHIESTPKDDQP